MSRMIYRLVLSLVTALLLTACVNTVDNMKLAAQEKFRQTLAYHFTRQFGKGIGVVVQGLAAQGSFLDNPLVRILLPPPVGLVIDVARDFQQNPRAVLLESLMNHAAEQAVPGAGPILQTLITEISAGDSTNLFAAGKTAATDYLREKAGGAVYDALLPVVAQDLAASGAVEIYAELLKAHEATALVTGMADGEAPPVAADELDDYVTRKTVDGLFRMLGDRETLIRDGISNMEQGSL